VAHCFVSILMEQMTNIPTVGVSICPVKIQNVEMLSFLPVSYPEEY